MNRLLIAIIASIVLVSCSNQSFKRDTGKAGPPTGLNGPAATPTPVNPNVVDQANAAPTPDPVDCQEVIVEKPEETMEIKNFFPGRDYLNQNCNTNISTSWADQGAVRADPATLKHLCFLHGFNEVGAYGKRRWDSDDDNHMSWWDPKIESFVLVYPTPPGTLWINMRLECKGKIYKKCENQAPVKCVKK